MKNRYIIIIQMVILVIISINYISYEISSEKKVIVKDVGICEAIKPDIKHISYNQLLKMNSKLESNHKWDVANRYGYLGKYQIGRNALLDLGYDSVWVEQLHQSIYEDSDTTIIEDVVKIRKFYYFDLSLFPKAKQEEAIKKFLAKNEKVYLKKHIKKYVGKEIGGVRITKAGILSASFIGTGYIDKYLSSNGKINLGDGNGHTVKDRLRMFENYEIR